jgi:threonine synthase
MRYTSTRGSAVSCTFEEALVSGYAPDGGLFVPEALPAPIAASDLEAWSTLDYPALVRTVLRRFISPQEVSDEELRRVCDKAFEGFADPAEAVPVVKLSSKEEEHGGSGASSSSSSTCYVAELFHGPTFCFKDLGMRTVVNLLSLFATRRRRGIALLVSTTGDTGPAAVRAASDAADPLLSVLVHYPDGRISDFQRRQLTTVRSDRVRVAAFAGGGDDMDEPIKRLLATAGGSGSLWTGINSYNVGRPILQLVHYVWTYLRVAEREGIPLGDPGQPIDICLPTGAMGNIVGGYMAVKMGLPVRKLVAAVNANDITHRVMSTGRFHPSDNDTMVRTLSEAINIGQPYNFERLLYYLTGENQELVCQWMTDLDANKRLDLNQEWLTRLQQDFASASVTDDEMCETVRKFDHDYNYLADPHTAVALCAAEKLGYLVATSKSSSKRPVLAVLATASPCKFEHSMTTAVGTKRWKDYLESDSFPAAAKRILALPERTPVHYERKEGSTLKEAQKQWESKARQIIAELESQSTTK